GAELRGCRNPTEVGVELTAAVGADAPRSVEAGYRVVGGLLAAVAKDELARARHGDRRQVGVGDQHRRHLTLIGCGRVAHDAELEEAADARVRGAAER